VHEQNEYEIFLFVGSINAPSARNVIFELQVRGLIVLPRDATGRKERAGGADGGK
jgi:hypothetical protein